MMNKVDKIINAKQFPQKSQAWLDERFKSITATDVAPILESHPHTKKIDILWKKLTHTLNPETANTLWGNKYEPVAKEIYQDMVHDAVQEIGLIKHDVYSWLGATPDGIRLNGKLLEIKCVRNRNITNRIPYYYWIQVQIQMEVCDLEKCDFFQCKFQEYTSQEEYQQDSLTKRKGILVQDEETTYWKLVESSCETILRDREWFQHVLPIIQDFWITLTYYRQLGIDSVQQEIETNRKRKGIVVATTPHKKAKAISKYFLEDWSQWVVASEIRNYILNDPLLDWLNHYGEERGFIRDSEHRHGLNDYLQGKDQLFQEAIAHNLRNRFGHHFVEVAQSCHLYSMDKVEETYRLIQAGIPIIYHPVLHDRINRTVCQPDLIIRTDHVPSLVREEIKLDWNAPPHYVVVDIRYLSLSLKNNGEIYNSANINYYKAKVLLETAALNNYQGIKANRGFLLGRKYKIYRGKGKPATYHNNCFATLGLVDLTDEDLQNRVAGAVKWLRDLKANGQEWEPDTIHPNMCNLYDYPWTSVKESLAKQNREITLIHGLGVKERQSLLTQGVSKWDQIQTEHLKMSQNKVKQIMAIIQANNGKGQVVFPEKIPLNEKYQQIFMGMGIHFYVDFESINDHYDDFNRIRNYSHQQPKLATIYSGIVFLIGVGFIHPYSGKWIFRSFVVDRVDYQNEKLILEQFLQYLDNIRQEFGVPVGQLSHLYHWSNSERSTFQRLTKKYQLEIANQLSINWVDLMEFFKSVPITIQGVFNYGLKNVANALYEHGLISTKWMNENLNGLSAMIAATHCHTAQGSHHKLSQMSGLKEIIAYNEVDCRVMWDIIQYLKKDKFAPLSI